MPPMPPCKKRDGASRLKLCCWVIEVLELLGLVAVHCNSQTSKDQPWQLSKPYKYWLIWCVCIIQDRTRSYKYCSLIGLGLVLCFKWACPRNRVPIALLKFVKRRAGRQRNSSAHLWRTIALHACKTTKQPWYIYTSYSSMDTWSFNDEVILNQQPSLTLH
jgi:hypothetical protein